MSSSQTIAFSPTPFLHGNTLPLLLHTGADFGRRPELFISGTGNYASMDLPTMVERNVDLTPFNTFRVQSIARFLVRVHTVGQLQALANSDAFKACKNIILGGGSNVLFCDRSFDGIVLKNEILGIRLFAEENATVVLEAGGGVSWQALTTYCIEHEYGGLESLSMIPGTVGAAPVQNISAYGAAISDVLHRVTTVDLSSGNQHDFSNSECLFSYRESIFSKREGGQNLFITSVAVKLVKAPYYRPKSISRPVQQVLASRGDTDPSIRSISEAVSFIRGLKLPDPGLVSNAGCFFKNPYIKESLCRLIMEAHPDLPHIPDATGGQWMIPGAWLVEKCGWKGRNLGNVGVSGKHALVLVHYGGARGSDILDLVMQIRNDVRRKFSIDLVMEVNIIRQCF